MGVAPFGAIPSPASRTCPGASTLPAQHNLHLVLSVDLYALILQDSSACFGVSLRHVLVSWIIRCSVSRRAQTLCWQISCLFRALCSKVAVQHEAIKL